MSKDVSIALKLSQKLKLKLNGINFMSNEWKKAIKYQMTRLITLKFLNILKIYPQKKFILSHN